MPVFNEKKMKQLCEYLDTKHPKKHFDFFRFAVAQQILREVIDNEWVNQALFPDLHPRKSGSTKKVISFFGSKDQTKKFYMRVYMLANWLYDLQGTNNLEKVVSAIKSGDINHYVEVEVGEYLYSRDISFEYVKPQSIKGLDYDIKINDFVQIHCEVKHKIESTDFSEKTLASTLSNANKQIPTDEPALFYIRIPFSWTRIDGVKKPIDSVLKTFFSRNSNVLGIMFIWEEEVADIDGLFIYRYRFEKNLKFNFDNESNSFLEKLTNTRIDGIGNLTLDVLIKKYVKRFDDARDTTKSEAEK